MDEIPIQWVPKFELFTNDLPNFPLVYVHSYKNKIRIFGFPIAVSFEKIDGAMCTPKIRFLSNIDLSKNQVAKEIVKSELSERFGITNSVSLHDVISACNSDKDYEVFFKAIWEKVIKPDHGNLIPFGRYYEKFYSIFRFNAAWNTAGRGGRQQELRIVYWFLREYGNKVKINLSGRDFYQFFLLPTFDEVKSKSMSEFPRFEQLLSVVEKIWKIEFTRVHDISGKKIYSMTKAWPKTRDAFVKYLNNTHVKSSLLTQGDAYELGLLVDMFNRNPLRAAGFIWSTMSIFRLDYENWSRDFIDKFYLYCISNKKSIAVYPKVVSCFLQQGFENEHAIPMDEWVLTFVRYPLGMDGAILNPKNTIKKQEISTHEEFFKKFNNRAKLERFIWLVSQSKKVNMDPVFDMFWCIRFGTTEIKKPKKRASEIRRQNPISCYQCELRDDCKGYAAIEQCYVWVCEGKINDVIREQAKQNDCIYICSTSDQVPKKIEWLKRSKTRTDWIFTDEFSGLRMKPEYKTNLTGKQLLKDLVLDLQKHNFEYNSRT